MTDKQLQVVVTSGPENISRAAFALQTALASAASGVQVHVFLVLEAGQWVCEPRRRSCSRIYTLIDQLEELGARITYCSACVEEQCAPEHWPPAKALQQTGAAPSTVAAVNASMHAAGLAQFVEGVVQGIPTITI